MPLQDMAVRLSEGAIAGIMEGEQPVKPILQLINIRPISTGSGPPRYRLLMSDGVNTLSSFMLATQLNSLVDNKSLGTNAICKINRHVVNTLKDGRMVVILMDLEVIRSADAMATKIGNPVPYAEGGSTGLGAKLVQPAVGPTANQAGTQQLTGSSVGNMPKYSGPPKMPGTFGGPNLPTTPGGTQPKVVPIASLNPYQSRWTICARVTQKGQIRTWSNSRGEGKLFSIEMVDESGEIRATAFNEQVDKFFPLIELNKVYYFSKGNLKTANKQYSTVKNDYEITFVSDTSVIPCEDADHLPSVQFNFVPIGDLEEVKTDSVVDVLGICASCEEATKITIKSSNREVAKRDVRLLDTSGKTVTVTLWGNEAEKFDGSRHPVVAVKGAKVSDFGGRSLSVLMSSMLIVNPDRPEAFKLRAWFDREGQLLESSSISNTLGASTPGGYTNWKSLSEAQTENLGQGDKADYYSCVGTVVHIRKENCLYKACPSQDCNKKLIDEQNGLYRCEKCDREFPNFKYCMILGVNIADFEETQWITCFKQAAETILGHDAAYLGELREKDNLAFDKVLEKAHFTSYEFRIRVKEETFNDQTRLKATAVDVRPVDYREHCKRLIASIRKNAT